MPSSNVDTPAEYHAPPRYEMRVRGTKYLWGSAGITQDMTFHRPLVLQVHNDLHGDAITLSTRVASGIQTPLGTLQPGECISIPVQGLSGVFAQCTGQTMVTCGIH
jgi:hypothetical protein